MDVAEDQLLFQEGLEDEEDSGAKSDEDPDEISDDDVLSESASLRALQRAALRVGIITGRNPNVLFLTIVRIQLQMAGEAIMTGVDMQAGDVVAISIDGIVVWVNDDPDGENRRVLTLSLHLETTSS
ncbi:hypothetical protein Tco_1112625 [Tanacetum coccineum]|uniref:Uncharacterized protein n=1 Tax=Tanacetum coccineum TaxID=301880 RepID=A0ABQ5IPY0_9ASTR